MHLISYIFVHFSRENLREKNRLMKSRYPSFLDFSFFFKYLIRGVISWEKREWMGGSITMCWFMPQNPVTCQGQTGAKPRSQTPWATGSLPKSALPRGLGIFEYSNVGCEHLKWYAKCTFLNMYHKIYIHVK